MTHRMTAFARPTTGLARIGRRVAGVLAEVDYAQRRMFTLITSPDAYLTDRDQPADCYAEFLFRTSGSLLREPTAADRADQANRADRADQAHRTDQADRADRAHRAHRRPAA